MSLEKIQPWEIKHNFDLVPGDLELHRLEFGSGQGREHRVKRLVEHLGTNESYDIVIIDTPPTPSAWMMSALLASQQYVIPVKPEPLSRVGIDLLSSVVSRVSENYGHSIHCLGVILTMADARTIVLQDTIDFFDKSKPWKGLRFENMLPQRTAIARGQGSQRLILDLNQAPAKSAITRITKEFLERLNP